MHMEGTRFDSVVRALGAGGTRRGFVGLLAALAAGGAAADAGAKRKCRSDSPAGQCCRKKGGVVSCTCTNGGTVCGANCCRMGQECENGQCVAMPNPDTCVAYGQACKDVGIPCCAGLQCGSGQGGSEVACWVAKTARCDSTSECIYGTECKDGICVGLPPAPTCSAASCPASVCSAVVDSDKQPYVAPGCVDDVCACTCKAVVDVTEGVECRTNADCTAPFVCLAFDVNVLDYCTSDSTFCCCGNS